MVKHISSSPLPLYCSMHQWCRWNVSYGTCKLPFSLCGFQTCIKGASHFFSLYTGQGNATSNTHGFMQRMDDYIPNGWLHPNLLHLLWINGPSLLLCWSRVYMCWMNEWMYCSEIISRVLIKPFLYSLMSTTWPLLLQALRFSPFLNDSNVLW